MQIKNFEDTLNNPYVAAIFDLYHETIQRTDYNLELCKTKAGGFYVKFPDIKNRRNVAIKPYIRACAYSIERDRDFQKKVLELLQPFLPKVNQQKFTQTEQNW